MERIYNIDTKGTEYEEYILMTNSQDIIATLQHVKIDERYISKDDITAILALVGDGFYEDVLVTDSNIWRVPLTSWYRAEVL